MAYKLGKKVKEDKKVVRRYLAGIGASIAILAGAAVPALAANAGGGYCQNSSNGCSQSGAESGSCAGHGAFGAFGQHGDVTHDFSGGANGDATAYNNSTLCGNPQGAAGQLGS